MKNFGKVLLIVLAAVVIALGVRFIVGGPEDSWLCINGLWVKHGEPSAAQPVSGCGQSITNFEECIAAGKPVMESYPRQCNDDIGNSFTEIIGNEMEKNNLIKINQPRPNEVIGSPLEITGEARGNWFFEASFPVKLYDSNDNLIVSGIATAEDDWMSEDFVSFRAELEFDGLAQGTGRLVLERDNPSGLPEHEDNLWLPIVFGEQKKINVKVFFNNSILDPDFSCNKVFPVMRQVDKTEAVARAALGELLRGVTAEEEAQGFMTSINPGVEIQKLVIEQGVARVDFSAKLDEQVGGSCRVAAIAAQITETLKQFPTVSKVIISVDGRTEDILQP